MANEIDDGGSTSPYQWGDQLRGGLRVRDAFAMAALQGLLSSEVYCREIDQATENFRDHQGIQATPEEKKRAQAKVVANTAFYIADAMIARRRQP
jgi:hypothetical protein